MDTFNKVMVTSLSCICLATGFPKVATAFTDIELPEPVTPNEKILLEELNDTQFEAGLALTAAGLIGLCSITRND